MFANASSLSWHRELVRAKGHFGNRSLTRHPKLVEISVSANFGTITASLDVSLVLIGLGLFLGILQFAGGPLVLTWKTLPVAGARPYGSSTTCCSRSPGGDTPGTGWVQLRLVNYDGQPPKRD